MKPCQTGKLASKKGVTLGNQSAQEEIDTAHPLGTDALGGESEDTIVLSPSLSTTLSPDLSFYLPPSSSFACLCHNAPPDSYGRCRSGSRDEETARRVGHAVPRRHYHGALVYSARTVGRAELIA